MRTALAMLFIVCPFAALTFIVRLVCALFSPKVSDEMRRHPVIHWIWGGFAFLGVLLVLGVLNPMWWPPPSVERRGQRQKVVERVRQRAGGQRFRGTATPWSHSIATAHSTGIVTTRTPCHQHSRRSSRGRCASTRRPCCEISKMSHRLQLFASRFSACILPADILRPILGWRLCQARERRPTDRDPSRGGVSGNGYRSYTPVTDRIYEIY